MDNGGRAVTVPLEFEKEVNLISDNNIINKILCLFSDLLKIAPQRINDELGSYCDHPMTWASHYKTDESIVNEGENQDSVNRLLETTNTLTIFI